MVYLRRGGMALCLIFCACVAWAQTPVADPTLPNLYVKLGGAEAASPAVKLPESVQSDIALRWTSLQGLRNLADGLRAAGAFATILTGPADALFADGQGRRVGTVGGAPLNEIPGARVVATGAAGWYQLPADAQYHLSIAGADAGFGVLTLLSPDPEGLAVRAFEDIPLDVGSRASAPIMDGGDAQAVLTATGLIAPSVSGVIDLFAPIWTVQTESVAPPPADLPPEMRPVALAPDSVVKEAIFGTGEDTEGRLSGVGNVFAFGVKQIILYLRFEDAPAKTELVLTWMHEGKTLLHQIIEATGSGGVTVYLMAVSKPEIWAGNHAVIINENGRHVGTVTFVVR